MLISEEIKRISQLMEVKSVNRPDLQGEMDEIQRVTQYLNREEGFHVKVNELVDLFDKSTESTLSDDVWSKLENTESNEIKKGDMDSVYDVAKKYNKSNPDKLKSKFEDGTYKRPLILKFNNRYHLVAGNTRLCTAAAMGLNPKVFIGTLSTEDQMDTDNNSDK
jgi:hypothetical protein